MLVYAQKLQSVWAQHDASSVFKERTTCQLCTVSVSRSTAECVALSFLAYNLLPHLFFFLTFILLIIIRNVLSKSKRTWAPHILFKNLVVECDVNQQ